jgi:hypothetical protein
MATLTETRKPVNRVRHVRLVVGLNPDGKNGLLRITERKGNKEVIDEYFIDRIPADFGAAYLVEKRDYRPAGEDESRYHVNLSDDGAGHSCECRGFLRWGHCRHVEALAVLRDAGRL